MNAGRNDPCPCGSGKKYKKCCLAARESATRPDASMATRDRALLALGRWVKRSELDEIRDAAFDTFSGGDARPDDDEPVADEDVKFFSYYCFDHALAGGRSLADVFLERAGHRLDAEERRAIERLTAARLRPYQVTEVVIDEGLWLHDLWTKERLFVSERSATHQLRRWDLLAGRVIRFEDDRLELDGGLYLFPIRLKEDLMALLRRAERAVRQKDASVDDDFFWRVAAPLIHAFWLARVVFAERPKLVTSEGDPLEFGRVVFDVADMARVRTSLKAHAELMADHDDRWTWIEVSDNGELGRRSLGHLVLDPGQLVLETSSRRRAQRGRRLLEEAAGTALRHRSTRYESAVKAMARGCEEAGPATEPPLPPEEAAAVIASWKDQHYRTWPDTALPALGGHTPRDAARLKTVRPKLIDLLHELENGEARGARPDNPPYDFGWVWAELGLERQV